MNVVGQPIPHESAELHVTGRARYTADLPEPPRLLSAWPVQAPTRGRIVALDPGPALETLGVVAVLTAADVAGGNHVGPGEPLLPQEEVSYAGQAVAWVIGRTAADARAGAERVRVEIEPLPAILSIEEALAAGSFLTDWRRIRRGEPEQALAAAEHRIEGELVTGAQDHFYLETHTARAELDESGNVLVHSSTQHPSETQAVVAEVLGLPRNRVTVECPRMGGGFGGKETQANGFAAVAALGASLCGAPVQVRLNRAQDMTLTGKRHPFLARYRAGFDGDGHLVALLVQLFADGGFSLDLSAAVLDRALLHVDNAYFIPHLDVAGRVVKTHRASNTAFRGFGGPQGMLVVEEVMARIAHVLGLPPHRVRERNFYSGRGETNATHYGQEVEGNRLASIWAQLKDGSGFERRREAVQRFNLEHRWRKRGIAITPVKFGISFTQTHLNQAGALVLIYRDGTVQVNHGGTEMGQGLHTKMRQVAAEALGLPLEAIRVMPTRTDKVPNTSPTAASSSSDLNGQAVRAACETLKARVAPVAAELLASRLPLPVNQADLLFTGGRVGHPGYPECSVSFQEVVERAYLSGISLEAAGFYRTPDLYYDPAKGRGRPFHYFVFGAAVSEVEVDGFTGTFDLRQVDILHDAGASLNPLVDLGQMEGGFVQGVGWLTMEELAWDAQGRLLTHGPSTYKIPGIADVPGAFHVRFLPDAEQPGVIYGSKAVGEPPLMLAISVREAIREAVAAFAPAGAQALVPLECPSTPEAVLRAIQAVRSPRAGVPV